MRLIAFALAAFVAGGPAAAQNWQEYSYPAYSFTVAFPADPQIETTTYRLPGRRAGRTPRFTVRQNDSACAARIRAIREGCRGGAANPAGLDDPRCARQ